MNLKFERELIEDIRQIVRKNSQKKPTEKDTALGDVVYTEDLKSIKGLKLAIDANVLLSLVSKKSNPLKFLQEGACALDIGMQDALVELIKELEAKYQIKLLIVIDGLLPKWISDK